MSGGVEPCQGLAGSWVLTKQTVVLPIVEETFIPTKCCQTPRSLEGTSEGAVRNLTAWRCAQGFSILSRAAGLSGSVGHATLKWPGIRESGVASPVSSACLSGRLCGGSPRRLSGTGCLPHSSPGARNLWEVWAVAL